MGRRTLLITGPAAFGAATVSLAAVSSLLAFLAAGLDAILGSTTVGRVAERLSFGWDSGISEVLLGAVLGRVLSPGTRAAAETARQLVGLRRTPSWPEQQL